MMKYDKLFPIVRAGLSYSILFLWCATAWGYDLTLIPSLKLRGEYDDNVTFSRKVEEDDFIGTASPALTFGYRSELVRFDSTLGADFKGYMDESDLNTTTRRCNMNGSYQITERYSLSGNFSYTKDTTLESELEETGLVVGREDRKRLTGGGGITYRLDEVSNLGMEFYRSSTRYEGQDYVDYRSNTAIIYYNHTLNDQRDTITVQSMYSNTRSDVSKIRNYGLSFGLAHAFTERLRFDGYVGIRYTKSDYRMMRSWISIDPATGFLVYYFSSQKEKDNDVGGTANISLTGQGEISSWLVGYSRDLTYSSYGESIETQRLYGKASRKLTPRMEMGIAGSFYMTESQGNIRDEESRYYEITPSLEYRITEDHSLRLAYNYSRDYDKRLVSDRTAERNRIWLTLIFRFKGF